MNENEIFKLKENIDKKVSIFKKHLSDLNIINNWDDGKLEKFYFTIDFISSVFKNFNEKIDNDTLDDEIENLSFYYQRQQG